MLLKQYLVESMNKAMKPYLSSEPYLKNHAAASQYIEQFCSKLPESQKDDFNQLITMMTTEWADYSEETFLAGVKIGMALKQEILSFEA